MSTNKRELLAGYVDGELSDDQKREFEEALRHDPDLRAELEEFMGLKDLTGIIKYADLPDEVWESYWESIYKKLERGTGWIFFSIGAIGLLCYGLFELFYKLYTNSEIPMLVKVLVSAFGVGSATLLVSFARERLFAYKRERYSEVTK